MDFKQPIMCVCVAVCHFSTKHVTPILKAVFHHKYFPTDRSIPQYDWGMNGQIGKKNWVLCTNFLPQSLLYYTSVVPRETQIDGGIDGDL